MRTDIVADVRDALTATGGGRVVIGLTGPPGAGKTTAARRLADDIAIETGVGSVGSLPMDGFHLSNAVLAQLGRRDRKGAPDTFDVDGYTAILARVIHADSDVYVPGFDHSVGEPIAASAIIPASARVVITEGNYLGLSNGPWNRVRPLLTRLYYVDAPAAVRHERLIRRHIDAGRTPDDAAAWVRDVDEPNAELIATTRPRADVVISGAP